MTSDRTFAPWVKPIAKTLRESRGQVIRAARQMFPEHWRMPSLLPGWSYQDILAHMGKGNDQLLQKILRSVVARERLDASILNVDTNAANARGVEERRGRSVEELIAELEEAGEEIQELLSGLTEADEELGQDDLPMSLGEFLRQVQAEDHDREHLAQLRPALDSVML